MKTTLAEKVKADILQHTLIENGDSVLVAVSGGMDSVCLLHLLLTLKNVFSLHISVAHVNHMLRGAESARDEAFVRNLCEKHNIPFYVKRIDVKKAASEQKLSVEEAGRNIRYAFFREIQQKLHADKIATAHNKDDNVETVCMRFMRGTGIRGLGGIPIQNGNIIRPLLHVSRKEIEAYTNELSLSYVTDSSNLSDDYTRNKIRHHAIPYIVNHFNKNFVDTISENIISYGETESFFEMHVESIIHHYIHDEYYGAYAKISILLQEHPAIVKRMIKKTLDRFSNLSISNKTVQKIYDAICKNKMDTIDVSLNFAVHIAYGTIYFFQKNIAQTLSYMIDFEYGQGDISFSDKNTLYLKPALDKNNLSVRSKLPGDRIFLGNCGHKKVKDILIDEKIPSFIRDSIPVVLYEDEIIWICGIRDNPIFRALPGDAYIKLTYRRRTKNAQ